MSDNLENLSKEEILAHLHALQAGVASSHSGSPAPPTNQPTSMPAAANDSHDITAPSTALMETEEATSLAIPIVPLDAASTPITPTTDELPALTDSNNQASHPSSGQEKGEEEEEGDVGEEEKGEEDKENRGSGSGSSPSSSTDSKTVPESGKDGEPDRDGDVPMKVAPIVEVESNKRKQVQSGDFALSTLLKTSNYFTLSICHC